MHIYGTLNNGLQMWILIDLFLKCRLGVLYCTILAHSPAVPVHTNTELLALSSKSYTNNQEQTEEYHEKSKCPGVDGNLCDLCRVVNAFIQDKA